MHRTSGGKLRTKCALHFAAAIKNQKVTGLKKLEFSGNNAIIQKRTITGKSIERMRKSRNVCKETVAHLADENVRRIAAELLKLSKTQKYVIIPNVASSSLTPLDIAATGKIVYHPFQSKWTWPPFDAKTFPLYTSDVVAVVNVVFPLRRTVKLKLLKSQAGDTPQTTHTDFVLADMKIFPLYRTVKLKLLKSQAGDTPMAKVPLESWTKRKKERRKSEGWKRYT
jgi:hypothetical protein